MFAGVISQVYREKGYMYVWPSMKASLLRAPFREFYDFFSRHSTLPMHDTLLPCMYRSQAHAIERILSEALLATHVSLTPDLLRTK